MSKINFEDIEDNYATALAEKETNKDDVVNAIIDNDLSKKFVSIQKGKEKINSLEDLTKYHKDLKSFFDDVYKIITAPGVQKFVDWLNELSLKGLEINTRNYITEFLIKEYATHDENIKNIITNKDVVKANNSLFENIKKSVIENINKRIISSFTSKDKVEEELPDFLEELNELMDGLADFEELQYTDVKEFYTSNIDEKNNDNYIPEIDEETDFYFDLLAQVVKRKDFLTTDKEKIQLSTIVENVQSSIDDIVTSIETIKTIEVSTDSDDDITLLYNKFEKSFKFNNVENVTDYIQESINDTWNKIIEAYNTSQVFYSEHTLAKVDKLINTKEKWKGFDFADKVDNYISNLKTVISDNPIDSIKDEDISKIKIRFGKIAKKIESLEEDNPREVITEYFSSLTNDYQEKKIEILKRLKTNTDIINKIKGDITAINDNIKTITDSDNLLDALNDEFTEGILGSYDYIQKQFTSAIEQSEINDDLDYLYKINSEGNEINKKDLENDLDRYKRLLEYDLINLTITKNI